MYVRNSRDYLSSGGKPSYSNNPQKLILSTMAHNRFSTLILFTAMAVFCLFGVTAVQVQAQSEMGASTPPPPPNGLKVSFKYSYIVVQWNNVASPAVSE